MPIEFSEDVLQNDNFSATTDESGNLVLEHKQTGGQFKFDATKNRWIPVQGVDLEGSDVDNVGTIDSTSVTTDSVDATDVTTDSVDATDVTTDSVDSTSVTTDSVDSTSVTTDDATVNDLLSAENAEVTALEAAAITHTADITGVQEALLQITGSTDSSAIATKETLDVSTTAVSIFEDLGRGAFAVVTGNKEDSSGASFTDIVIWDRIGGTTVLGSIDNTSDGRTYNQDGADLDLAMSDGTYDVQVIGTWVNPPN